MTLGGLQDLQEQLNLINPVDTHLVNQVSQLKGNKHEPKKNVSNARAVRQEYTPRARYPLPHPFARTAEAHRQEVGKAVTTS